MRDCVTSDTLDGDTRRYLSEVGQVNFDLIPPGWQQTGSGVPEWFGFPIWQTRFVDVWRLSEVEPVLLDTLGTIADDHFRSAAATAENAWNRLAIRRTVIAHEKTRLTHRKLFRNSTSCYEPPR